MGNIGRRKKRGGKVRGKRGVGEMGKKVERERRGRKQDIKKERCRRRGSTRQGEGKEER